VADRGARAATGDTGDRISGQPASPSLLLTLVQALSNSARRCYISVPLA